MATLYVSEYANVAAVGHTSGPAAVPGQAPLEPSLAEQTVTISGSHAESAAFNDKTTFIRVHTDAICSIAIGVSPVATTSMKRLAANQTEYFGVAAGYKFVISVITNT